MVIYRLTVMLAGLLLACLPVRIQAEQKTGVASFKDVLDAALAQSLEAKKAGLSRSIASIDRKLLSYKALPKLGLSGTIEQRQPKAANPREQSYGLSVDYNIYDFGRTSAKRHEADYAEKIEMMTIAEINEALRWRVARAYLDFLSSLRLLEISRGNLDISSAKMATTKANYQKGLRSENDLIAAEADLGESNLSFEKSQDELRQKRTQLDLLAGFAADRSLPREIASADIPPLRNAKDWDRLLQTWALQPSAAEARRGFERKKLEASEDAVTASMLPTIDLALSAQDAGTWEKTERVYAGQLQLNWDIPWSGQHVRERERLSLEKSVIDTEQRIEERDRRDAIALAQDRYEANKRLSDTADKQVQLRARQYELTKLRYNTGKATALELSNVELELGNARLERERISNALTAAVLDLAEAKNLADPSIIFDTHSH